MHTYSAWAPNLSALTPKTLSPTWNSVTAGPTASISPASSVPRMPRFGRRSPLKNRTMNGLPCRNPVSVRLTVVA